MGGDFALFYKIIASYFESGTIPSIYYAIFPLTTFIASPYLLVDLETAAYIRMGVVFCLIITSITLIKPVFNYQISKSQLLLFLVILIIIVQISYHLMFLNVYAETVLFLLLSLLFYKKKRYLFSGIFLALAIMFKMFLIPLVLVPILCKEYKLALYTIASGIVLIITSILIFGLEQHLNMVENIVSWYQTFRRTMLDTPPYDLFFTGYQDFLYKLFKTTRFHYSLIPILTAIIASLYVLSIILILYFTIVRFRKISPQEQQYKYFFFFSILLILSLIFSYRTDMGLFYICLIPLLIAMNKDFPRLVTLGISLIFINRMFIEGPLSFIIPKHIWDYYFHPTLYVLSFPFIGVNILLITLVLYSWKQHKELKSVSLY